MTDESRMQEDDIETAPQGPVSQLIRDSRVGAKNFSEINLLLSEGLFFYKKDNRFLFNLLRERKEFFKEFWLRCHGLELVVEDNVAYRRLPVQGRDSDVGFRNPNIQIRGRYLFTWSGKGLRERSLVFMLFLRFYEEILRREDANEDDERRFFYHEFFTYAQKSFDAFFAGRSEMRPSDDVIFQACEDVFEMLGKYRFIELDEQSEIAQGDDRSIFGRGYARRHVIVYRALDGLRAYNPNTLIESFMERAYVLEKNEDDTAHLDEGEAEG